MIVDTSALLAIVFEEPEADAFLSLLATSTQKAISTASLLECWLVVDRHPNPVRKKILDGLLTLLGLEERPVTSAQIRLAREAYERFGKGRHPAALNYGDCFAYSLARLCKEPLLFKGEDFKYTDVEPAV